MPKEPDESYRNYIKRKGHVVGPAAIFLIVAFAVTSYFFYNPNSGSFDNAPLKIPTSPTSCLKAPGPSQIVKVLPASGSGAIMNIYVGKEGNRAYGESPPLSIQKVKLCPGSVWRMRMSQFTRADGQSLQLYQVASWAQVGNNGTQLTVWVMAAPHHGAIPSGPGFYSGSVSLDSAIVQGGQVPVRIHVAYPNVYLILAFGFLAAFAGFVWATLLHYATSGVRKDGYLFRNVTLCMAVLLAAAIPVVNVQVLSKPDWQGTISQFIGLATLIGAAAIATTPTLRALVIPKSLPQDSTQQPKRKKNVAAGTGATAGTRENAGATAAAAGTPANAGTAAGAPAGAGPAGGGGNGAAAAGSDGQGETLTTHPA
jgi:hypothetical protein